MAYKGFDISYCPTKTQLQNFWTGSPFYFTSFYTGPNASNATSFKGQAAMIKSIGYGLMLVYVGRQKSSSNLTKSQGNTDAIDAGSKIDAEKDANGNAAISTSATIFLDIEQGGQLSSSFLDYIEGFCKGIWDNTTYYPGIYCSYSSTADQIKTRLETVKIGTVSLADFTKFWVFRLSNPSPGCTVTTNLEPSDSGVSYADVWQYAQSPTGTECKITYNGTTLGVDLDLAITTNPSGA
ncbi:glycoside hydrolase domain-containing protein [Paenibacillus sediminis]